MAKLKNESYMLDEAGELRKLANVKDLQSLKEEIINGGGGTGGGWNPAQAIKDVVLQLGESQDQKLTYRGVTVDANTGSGGSSSPVDVVAFNISRPDSGSPFTSPNLPSGWTISTSGGSTLLVTHSTGKLACGGRAMMMEVPPNSEITAVVLDYASQFRITSVYANGGYNQAKIENLTANKYRVVLELVSAGSF